MKKISVISLILFLILLTAFVKNSQNVWNHFNDNQVEKLDKSDLVVSPSAYCLFYRKKNNLL